MDFTEGRSVLAAKKFGYVRVSTREQNLERQIHILREGDLLAVFAYVADEDWTERRELQRKWCKLV